MAQASRRRLESTALTHARRRNKNRAPLIRSRLCESCAITAEFPFNFFYVFFPTVCLVIPFGHLPASWNLPPRPAPLSADECVSCRARLDGLQRTVSWATSVDLLNAQMSNFEDNDDFNEIGKRPELLTCISEEGLVEMVRRERALLIIFV